MLQLHHRRQLDGWATRYVTSVVGCVWEAERRADVRVGGRISLQSPLVSPTMPPPMAATHWGLSGAGTRMVGQAGDPVALADRRRSTAHEDNAAAVL